MSKPIFLGKKRKQNASCLSSAEFAQRVLKVQTDKRFKSTNKKMKDGCLLKNKDWLVAVNSSAVGPLVMTGGLFLS